MGKGMEGATWISASSALPRGHDARCCLMPQVLDDVTEACQQAIFIAVFNHLHA